MNDTSKGCSVQKDTNTTRNHEGAKVHDLTSLETLFSKVLGSFFGESTYYEKRDAQGDFLNLVKLINSVPYEDREYVLKIALLGREYNMIQYPLSVLTACFNDERFKGEKFLDDCGINKLQYYSNKIIRRGRDVVDVMATQINAFGFDSVNNLKGNHRDLPLPIQLRKALKYKLESFSEYQLSKALNDSREVTLADCIKLLHPNPKKAKVSENFFSDVISGKVNFGGNEKQVQSELAKSRNKNSDSTVKDVADSLSTSSVMAIVKNLVALERAGVTKDSSVVDVICNRLSDRKQVRDSRLLPFRFYSAYKEVEKRFPHSVAKIRIMDSLIDALDLSVSNMTPLNGFNAILIDMSGSMNNPISSKSVVSAKEVACLLGAICFKQGVSDVYVFANQCEKIKGISSRSTVMDIFKEIYRHNVGGATYIDSALSTITRESIATGVKYDNLILLSDGDCYTKSSYNHKDTFSLGSYWRTGTVSPDDLVNSMIKNRVIRKVYVNDLMGNSFSTVNTDDFRKNLVTGFSERFVDMIRMYDSIGGSKDVREVIDLLISDLK